MTIEQYRKPVFNVDPLFISRWSPRAFSNEIVPDEVLWQLFEAARWSPSGANAQPWRFIYAKRGDEHWEKFVSLLNDRNRSWAKDAAALILLVSRNVRDGESGPVPSRSHSFDAGAAWATLALQAHQLGWGTRAIAGFDQDRARESLDVPNDYALQVIIALGKRLDPALLPEDIKASEKPNDRLPPAALAAPGRFAFV